MRLTALATRWFSIKHLKTKNEQRCTEIQTQIMNINEIYVATGKKSCITVHKMLQKKNTRDNINKPD